MGFLAEMERKASPSRLMTVSPPKISGRMAWRQIFNEAVTKEDRFEKPREQPAPNGGSWGRSMVSTDNATKRLLQALRSKAPGSPTANHYEQSKHYVGIIYAGIHRQNELLTQSEFEVFVKDKSHPNGKRPITSKDPPMGGRMVKPYDLVELLERPNKEDDFGDLMANWNLQLDLTGMALTWMVPNKLGTPFELYPIPTALAIPQPVVNPDYPDGYYRIQPMYPYGPFSSYPVPAASVGAAIPAQWMMRIKYPHPLLRYEGWAPTLAMQSHIDQHEQMDRARWYSMKRGINPSAVLNFDDMDGSQPLPEPEIERIKADFEAEQQGAENWAKLFVATPGSKLEPWGSRPVDMDFQAGWEQVSSFILGAGFGITKPAAGMTEASAYATLFASLKQLYWQTLDPKCSRVGKRLTREVAPYFGDDLIVEVRCKRLDDHDIAMQKASTGMQGKCITKNEMRKHYLDLPITEEEWGEEIAGTEKQDQQQEGMAGMMGGMMGGDAQQPPAPAQGEQAPPDNGGINALMQDQEQDPNAQESQPTPGDLDQGSLGPRKGLNRIFKSLPTKRKSTYEFITEAIGSRNGTH